MCTWNCPEGKCTYVLVRDPVTEVGTSEVDPELEGKELKIGERLSRDLSTKDKMNPANVTASKAMRRRMRLTLSWKLHASGCQRTLSWDAD